MKVKAIRTGYYNHKRRYEGDVFPLKERSHFSKQWMVEVGKEVEVTPEPEEADVPVEADEDSDVI